MDTMQKGDWYVMRRVPCSTCDGDGFVMRGNTPRACTRCNETGHHTIEVPLTVALKDIGIDVDAIQQAQRQAQRAAEVASMLANGILPD